MSVNKLFSEEWAVVGMIDPDNYAPGNQLTAAIDMAKWEQLVAIVMVGDRTAASLVDFAFQSSATSGGSYTAITGKSITQIVDVSPLSGASNIQKIVELRSDEVTSNNEFVKGSLTIAKSPTGNTDAAVLILGRGRVQPASDNDVSTVTEIVN